MFPKIAPARIEGKLLLYPYLFACFWYPSGLHVPIMQLSNVGENDWREVVLKLSPAIFITLLCLPSPKAQDALTQKQDRRGQKNITVFFHKPRSVLGEIGS